MSIVRRSFAPAILFVAVFCISVSAAVYKHYWEHPPFAEQAAIAGHLYRGEGFLSPFDAAANAPESSWTPPVYPFLIAGVYRVLGFASGASVSCLMVLNSLCYAAIAVGLYALGALLVSRGVGIIAAVLIAVHPLFLNFSSDFWDSFLSLAVFVWLLVWAARGVRSLWGALGLGVVMGILSLTNASYILAYPILLVIALTPALSGSTALTAGRRERVKYAGIAVAGFAVALLPWTIRNTVQFHRLFYVRGGASFELAMGNQPFATGWMEPAILSMHPARNREEREFLLTRGEGEFFHRSRERFFEEYRDDPPAFWERTGRRACYLFLSEPTKAPSQYPLMRNVRWHGYVIDQVLLNATIATLGLAGVWMAFRLRYRVSWIFFAGLLAEFPFFFASVGDRYTLPLRCVLVFFTAVCLWGIVLRIARGKWLAGPLVNPSA